MKFTVSTKEFMSALDRVAVIAKKKSPLQIFQYVKITADSAENLVTMETQNISEHLRVTLSGAEIIEDGFALINIEYSKFFNLKSDIVTVECENDRYFSIQSGKKRSEFEAENDRYEKEVPEFARADNTMFFVGKSELLDTFKVLAAGICDNPNKAVYGCYLIDPMNKSVVTCDGFKLIKKNIDWEFGENAAEMLIPGAETGFLNNLKKMIDYKREEKIAVNVSEDRKFGAFVGDNFTYTFRLEEGIFLEYMDMLKIQNNENVKFSFDIDEIISVMKEYAQINAKVTRPALLNFINNKLMTGIVTTNYKTADELWYDGEIPDGFYKGVNPKFLLDILNIFYDKFNKKNHTIITSASQLSPFHIFNDTYETIVCPMRIADDENVVNYVQKCAA